MSPPSPSILSLPATAALAITMVITPGPSAAQEAHYWSEQFGNRSMLLGGAVIGSVFDLGAVFYNPGRLALIENPAFVLSAKAYQWDRYTVDDGAGAGQNVKQSSFGGAPSLVAGTFTLDFLEDHQFAYAFLTRKRATTDFFGRVEREGELVDALPGVDFFTGTVRYNPNLQEEWIGLSWSRSWWEGISVGVTTFATTESRSQDLWVDMKALGEEGDVAALFSRRAYSYSAYGVLWKGGLAIERGPVGVGLTVTTPRISLTGSGSAEYEELLTGLSDTGEEENADRLETSFQSGLDAQTRSPWAVGLGVGWDIGAFTLHGSAEWYGSVSEFGILTSEPFVGQSTGDTLQYTIIDEMRPVLNLGLGVEYRIGDLLTGFASIATDNSSAPGGGFEITVGDLVISDKSFTADFILFGGGVDVKTRWADVTLGATFAAADQDFARFVDFPEEGGRTVDPDGETTTLSYSKWRFLLGFSIPFAADIAARAGGEEKAPPEKESGR